MTTQRKFRWHKDPPPHIGWWHKDPPPHIGWWNASASRTPLAWRWWDGLAWSACIVVCPNQAKPYSLEYVAKVAHEKASPFAVIQWTHAYPANARVPRISPNKRHPGLNPLLRAGFLP